MHARVQRDFLRRGKVVVRFLFLHHWILPDGERRRLGNATRRPHAHDMRAEPRGGVCLEFHLELRGIRAVHRDDGEARLVK